MLRAFRYEEIAGELRQQIARGEFAGQRRLPSERTLMRRYGVQRNTVRQALALLADEGWIVVEPKRGSFAAPGDALPETPAAVPATADPVLPASQARDGGAAAAPRVVLAVNAWNDASTAMDGLLLGLSQALAESGLTLLRFNSQPRPGQHLHTTPTPDDLAVSDVAGVVLWPQSPADPEALARLRDAVPLVLVDRRVLGFEADCVRFDDVAGGRLVTEHLLRQGHRRIGFLGDEAFAETVQQRWRGYTLALAAAGIAADPAWLALFNGIREPLFSGFARLFLAGAGEPLSAVVCSNDSTALTLLRFLRAEGLRVPGDVAVTGYGNLLPDYLDALELTTVAQPFEELGRAAGALLLERIARRGAAAPAPRGFRQIELPVRLIPRNSSGASGAK